MVYRKQPKLRAPKRPRSIKYYERQIGETAKAFEAFMVYRDAGLNRTIKQAAIDIGKANPTLEKWSALFHWVERAAAWDAEVDRRKRLAELKAVEDMRKRQIKMAMSMQSVAAQELLKMANKAKKNSTDMTIDPDIMIRLVKEGTTLERLNRGEPGEIVHSTIKEEVDYSKFSREDLKMLKKLKQKAKGEEKR